MADSMESFGGPLSMRPPLVERFVRMRGAGEVAVCRSRVSALLAIDRAAIACFMDRLFVGTSGWDYKSWAGSFYPSGRGRVDHLEYYAGQFRSVEINASFYRLQRPDVVREWYHRSPSGFRFAVKGSRFITHMKRLNVEPHSIQVFFDRAQLLEEKCGPILWQLPPGMKFDPERLDRFLSAVPKRFRHAVEFRHPSWYENEETFALLSRHRTAHVWLSSLAMPHNTTRTTDFVYLRFHGLEGGAAHDYTLAELEPWAGLCRECVDRGIDVHAYFNNDANTRAPLNAKAFREMVESGRSAARRPRPG
jgi:uncharacterized protein YecE (DUF72 family)